MDESKPDVWREISPLLDSAMRSLTNKECDVILLSLFENRSLKEVENVLGITEKTVRRDMKRGIEKLRKVFAKRGLFLSEAAIRDLLSTRSVQAAPPGLAKSVIDVVRARNK